MLTNQINGVEGNFSSLEANSLLRFVFQGVFVTAVFIVQLVAAINFLSV